MPSSHLPRILITGGSGQVGHCLKAQLEGCAELSGEMHRYYLEHQLRRQVTKIQLTLRDESVGSEQD